MSPGAVVLRDQYLKSLLSKGEKQIEFSIESGAFDRDIPFLAAKFPEVEEIELGIGFDLSKLKELCAFQLITSLSISIPIENANAFFQQLSYFPNLLKLYLDELSINKEDHFFIKLANFKNLTELGLYDTTLLEDKDLVEIANMPALLSMTLENGSLITDRAIEPLTNLNSLEVLTLGNLPSVKGKNLGDLLLKGDLQKLSIRNICITDHTLSQFKNWKGKELFLFDCDLITDEGIQSLYSLQNLEHFYFSGKNLLGPKFSHYKNFPKLKELDLSYTDIGIEELKIIGEKLPLLETLSLRSCENIEEKDLESLLKKLAHLKSLDIAYCSNLQEDFFKIFATLSLEELDVSGSRVITEKALEMILKMQTLKTLYVDHCHKIPKAFLEKIQKERPHLEM